MTQQSKWIADFLAYLLNERRFSFETGKGYKVDLRQLCEFLASRPHGEACEIDDALVAVKEEELNDFVVQVGHKAMPATVARKVASLRSFYKWLHQKGAVTENPATGIKRPKWQKKGRQLITDEQMAKLFAISNKNPITSRDLALLHITRSTGVSPSRLVQLSQKDVQEEHDDGTTILRIPGRVPRQVAIDKAATTALNHYRKLRPSIGSNQDSDPLFINHRGRSLSSRSVRRTFRKHMKRAGLGEGIGFCDFRAKLRTCAR